MGKSSVTTLISYIVTLRPVKMTAAITKTSILASHFILSLLTQCIIALNVICMMSSCSIVSVCLCITEMCLCACLIG